MVFFMKSKNTHIYHQLNSQSTFKHISIGTPKSYQKGTNFNLAKHLIIYKLIAFLKIYKDLINRLKK